MVRDSPAPVGSCKSPLCGRKIESAADFLYFTDVGILSEAERTTDENVREMLVNIVNRRLFKRAIVVSMNSFERPGYEEGDGESEDKYNLVYELRGTTLQEQRNICFKNGEGMSSAGLNTFLKYRKRPRRS